MTATLIYRGSTFQYDAQSRQSVNPQLQEPFTLMYRGVTLRVDPMVKAQPPQPTKTFLLMYRGATYQVTR